jgi:hypothetical protein
MVHGSQTLSNRIACHSWKIQGDVIHHQQAFSPGVATRTRQKHQRITETIEDNLQLEAPASWHCRRRPVVGLQPGRWGCRGRRGPPAQAFWLYLGAIESLENSKWVSIVMARKFDDEREEFRNQKVVVSCRVVVICERRRLA